MVNLKGKGAMTSLKIGDVVEISHSLTKTVHTGEEIAWSETVEEPVGKIVNIYSKDNEEICVVKISESFGSVFFLQKII